MREPHYDMRDGEGDEHEENVEIHEAEPVSREFHALAPEERVPVR